MMSPLAWRIALIGMLSVPCAAVAQTAYPDKPIRMIVAFPPGGPTDLVARIIGPALGQTLGQPVVFDNRPGAGGTVGAAILKRATPDGYTLLTAANGEIAIAPSLYPQLPYDPRVDFAPVSRIGRSPLMLAVHPGIAATSVKDLIALAKSKPGALNFGSGGVGTTPHLALELLKFSVGIDMVHVPYNGGGPALTAVMGGQIQMLASGVSALIPQAKSGKLRALGVTSDKRLPSWPDLPTIGETVPGYQVYSWFGVFVPKDTPKSVIARLHGAIVTATQKNTQVINQMTGLGIEVEGNDSAQFTKQVRDEIDKWAKVVKAVGVKAD